MSTTSAPNVCTRADNTDNPSSARVEATVNNRPGWSWARTSSTNARSEASGMTVTAGGAALARSRAARSLGQPSRRIEPALQRPDQVGAQGVGRRRFTEFGRHRPRLEGGAGHRAQ